MNGVHDMGGMHGFGRIQREDNEPVFHHRWEGRVFAVEMAGVGGANIDHGRHSIERLHPDRYLAYSYYERWLGAFLLRAQETGLLAPAELAAVASDSLPPGTPPTNPEPSDTLLRVEAARLREEGRMEPRFAIADRVRARNMHPEGHTRLPRYVRGKVGTIVLSHGPQVFPDTRAHGLGPHPQPLYNVRFTSAELWGESGGAQDSVFIDLWEDYLDPAEADG